MSLGIERGGGDRAIPKPGGTSRSSDFYMGKTLLFSAERVWFSLWSEVFPMGNVFPMGKSDFYIGEI